MTGVNTTRSAAGRLAAMAGRVLGGELPLRLRVWDGSEAGPVGGPVLVVHRRRALRRLLRSPGELGLTKAYIAGDVEIDGDLAEALSALWSLPEAGAVPQVAGARLLGRAARLGVFGRGPSARVPGGAADGRRHAQDPAPTRPEDLPAAFFELLLGPSMNDSCGYFGDGQDAGPAAAQQAGLDLICRQLGLESGSRHLDVGCGWGALICHAAQHYGTRSTGVTASRRQYDHVTKRVADAGLTDLVQVRLADHLDLAAGSDDGRFDAVSAIGTGEHVGDAEYPTFAGMLHRVLRPGGRAVLLQVSPGKQALRGSAFVRTHLAPQVQVRTLDATMSALAAAGLEVRDVQALPQDYDRTMRGWAESLERSWNGVVDLVGEGTARLWRLYLVGGALAFAEHRMGVEQIVAVRPAA